MRAIDLLIFAGLAFVIGLVTGWTAGYRRGRSRGSADGDARCRDNENRLKELQSQVKQLLGVPEQP